MGEPVAFVTGHQVLSVSATEVVAVYGDIDRFVAGNCLCVGELVFGVDRVLFCLVIFILSIDRLDRRRRVFGVDEA